MKEIKDDPKGNKAKEDAMRDMNMRTEEQDPEGMKLSDVQRIKRQKQLSDAAKKAPEVKNKIVPIKTSTTTSEDINLKPLKNKEPYEPDNRKTLARVARLKAQKEGRYRGSKTET